MEGNVSGVDLSELMQARQELNQELGIETDPNMYSDYNPNRAREELEKQQAEDLQSEAKDIDYQNYEPEPENDFDGQSQNDLNSSVTKTDTSNDSGISNITDFSYTQKDFNVYDSFSQFEIAENANVKIQDVNEVVNDNDLAQEHVSSDNSIELKNEELKPQSNELKEEESDAEFEAELDAIIDSLINPNGNNSENQSEEKQENENDVSESESVTQVKVNEQIDESEKNDLINDTGLHSDESNETKEYIENSFEQSDDNLESNEDEIEQEFDTSDLRINQDKTKYLQDDLKESFYS